MTVTGVALSVSGALAVNVVENMPVAMVSTASGFLVFDDRGRQLPLDPSKVPVDLPIAARRDTALFRLLANVRAERPKVFDRLDDVARVGDREVLMLNMNHDEYFVMDGALEVFDLIPGPKRMGVWPGSHVDIPPEAIAWAVEFLRRTLSAS